METRGVDPRQVAPALEQGGAAEARGPDGGEFGHRAAVARHHDAVAGGDAVENVAAVVAEVAGLDDAAHRSALLAKPLEEAGEEAGAADADRMVKELADLFEVVDTLLAVDGIDRERLLAEQARRRAERGGFERRLALVWTERA